MHKLRGAGAPLTVVSVRAVLVAKILDLKPEILQHQFKDGSFFCVSDSFVEKWMHDALHWSRRKATRAAHKLPVDWEAQCEHAFLWKAYAIKQYDIPASLYVNSDKTNIVYAPGDKMTWASEGDKQVSIAGGDEKCAFTVMVSVSCSGTLLPFQAIYKGKTERSLPGKGSPAYTQACRAGFCFEPSGTKTYWSNQSLMRAFVDKILSPYFEREKAALSLPPVQKTLWQIDVWSVHRSVEFRTWVSKNHPTIILDYVPGGCTPVTQPCDVGIQCPFKLSVKKSYHEDVVLELMSQLKSGKEVLTLNDDIGTLRDRTPQWLFNAYRAVNNKQLVQKVSTLPRKIGVN